MTTPQRITEIGLYMKFFIIRYELHVDRDGVGIVTKYHIHELLHILHSSRTDDIYYIECWLLDL